MLVHSSEASTRTVTLSYLARGFDWAADYIATVSGDGKTMDLGAWVTLANGNGVGFPAARTQVVAGRVNREERREWSRSMPAAPIFGAVLAARLDQRRAAIASAMARRARHAA